MPSFGHVNACCDNTIEHNATDFVGGNRFDGDANATGVFVFGCFHTLDRRVTDEAGQFNSANGWIRQRDIEADDATDRDSVFGRIVNAHR